MTNDDTRKMPPPEGGDTAKMPAADPGPASGDQTARMPASSPGQGGKGSGGSVPPGGPVSPGGPNPTSNRTKLLIILTVVGVFIIAGIIVLLVYLLGGDEPAPQVVTQTLTQTVTKTGPSETQTRARTQARTQTGRDTPAPGGDIHAVDWEGVLAPGTSGGMIEDVMYQDLTGDGVDEAVVTVRYEGSGAYLDYYIYTFQGGDLVNLFADYNISHGYVNFGSLPGSIVVDEPVYGPDDPNCCPSQIKYTTYTWSASARVFVLTTEEVVDSPTS